MRCNHCVTAALPFTVCVSYEGEVQHLFSGFTETNECSCCTDAVETPHRPLDHLEAAAVWQEAATESTASLKLIKCHIDLSCNLDFFMINSCWRTFRGPAGFCCVADEDRLAAVSSPAAAQLCRVYCNAWFDLNEAWRRHICVSSNLVWSLIQMLMLR